MYRKIKENEDSIFYDMIEILSQYGFRECKNNRYLNFLKIDETNYLLFRYLNGTMDLIQARYRFGDSPSIDESIWEELIQGSFNPENKEHRDKLKVKYQSLNIEK